MDIVLEILLKLLNLACLTFSSHLANRIRAEVLSLVLLNIHDRFWHSLYAFSISGYCQHGNTVEWNRIELKKGWNPEDIIHSLCAL
jgi:hypothetical protein